MAAFVWRKAGGRGRADTAIPPSELSVYYHRTRSLSVRFLCRIFRHCRGGAASSLFPSQAHQGKKDRLWKLQENLSAGQSCSSLSGNKQRQYSSRASGGRLSRKMRRAPASFHPPEQSAPEKGPLSPGYSINVTPGLGSGLLIKSCFSAGCYAEKQNIPSCNENVSLCLPVCCARGLMSPEPGAFAV